TYKEYMTKNEANKASFFMFTILHLLSMIRFMLLYTNIHLLKKIKIYINSIARDTTMPASYDSIYLDICIEKLYSALNILNNRYNNANKYIIKCLKLLINNRRF